MENTDFDMVVITIPDSPEAPVRYQGEEYPNYLSGRSRRAVLETGEDRESSDTLTRSGGTSCSRRRPAVDKDKGISISADPCGARRAEVVNLNQLNGHGHAHVAASQDINGGNSSNKGKEKAEDCGSVSNRETIDLSSDRQQNRGTKRRLVRQAADVHETAGVVERETRQQRRRRNGLTTTSSSASNEPQVTSPGEPFNNSRPPRIQNHQRRNNTQQVLEIQDSSPQVRAFRGSTHIENGVSDLNVRQMEADEILARELQEQLYQEERLIRHEQEQMDLNLARLLELVENSLPASSSPSRLEQVDNSLPASSTRNTPNSSTIAANPGGRSCLEARLQQHSSRRRLNPPQARPPVRSPPRGRGHRLGLAPDLLDRAISLGLAPDILDRAMNLSFPDDFYARLDFLEGIENAIEHTINSRNLLHMDRDFNEALDENNHRHGGASTQRINDLPESTVQTDKFEETCVICLETPTIGETIRHLPCLHKFHKDCIDPWLGRSKACPLCKSSVT